MNVKTVREAIRMNPIVGAAVYQAENIWYAMFPRLPRYRGPLGEGVAFCLRFKDEARYLAEWIDYHRDAGVAHFFLYNNNSGDDYAAVLERYVQSGIVTLIEWPRTPASPWAEEDAAMRSRGRFAWLAVVDADEFIVAPGMSIPQYLATCGSDVGVAMHWRMFGSNFHDARPEALVVDAYTRRAALPNRHVKVFVRPEAVTRNRNPHCWFFRRARVARTEHGRAVRGSIVMPPTADRLWMNHYYYKSRQDFLEKAARKPTHTRTGMRFISRTAANADEKLREGNDVEDRCAIDYWAERRAANGR